VLLLVGELACLPRTEESFAKRYYDVFSVKISLTMSTEAELLDVIGTKVEFSSLLFTATSTN
jgi:hypothetical protein